MASHDTLAVSIARTVLAVLVAVSLAVVPAGARAVAPVMSHGEAQSETGWTADMPDCRHHAPAKDQDSRRMGDCAAMAACGKCLNFAAAMFVAALAPAPTAVRLQSIVAEQTAPSRIGSPPFRPPRV